MKEQKLNFLTRISSAIKLERYQELATDKIFETIKYIAKLMIIFVLIVSIGITVKFNTMLDDGTLEDYMHEMENYGLESNITQEMIQEIKNSNRIVMCVGFYLITALYTYTIYFILVMMDILLLSVLGFFISRIFRIQLRYEAVYNISAYALTLSIILNMLYITANLLTGFTIEYFTIVYNIISYIYLIAAILIIKSDIIKTNIELMAIMEEQEKVRKELETQKQEKDTEEKGEENKKEEKSEDEKTLPENNSPLPERENG